MAPVKTSLRLAGNPLLRDAIRCQKPSKQSPRPDRPYSASKVSAKPRRYSDPPKPKPLVGTRTQAPKISPPNAKPPPGADSDSKGVYAPYWRISLGIVFCGSLVYSMVPFVPPNSIPKLTYMHTSSPPPSNSKPPPSQTEITSLSANQA